MKRECWKGQTKTKRKTFFSVLSPLRCFSETLQNYFSHLVITVYIFLVYWWYFTTRTVSLSIGTLSSGDKIHSRPRKGNSHNTFTTFIYSSSFSVSISLSIPSSLPPYAYPFYLLIRIPFRTRMGIWPPKKPNPFLEKAVLCLSPKRWANPIKIFLSIDKYQGKWAVSSGAERF